MTGIMSVSAVGEDGVRVYGEKLFRKETRAGLLQGLRNRKRRK
jgi:hypothetical protein